MIRPGMELGRLSHLVSPVRSKYHGNHHEDRERQEPQVATLHAVTCAMIMC